jgi:hypothetical protein
MDQQVLTVTGMTNTGAITGSRQVGQAPDIIRAYLYTPNHGFQDLGLPTSDQGTSFANAMNNNGRIIGTLRDGDLNTADRTFIWQADHLR